MEAELIPEWGPKYFEYKVRSAWCLYIVDISKRGKQQAKKKLRATARVARSLSQIVQTPYVRSHRCPPSPGLHLNNDEIYTVADVSDSSRLPGSAEKDKQSKDNGVLTKSESLVHNVPEEIISISDERSPLKSKRSTAQSLHYGATTSRSQTIAYSDDDIVNRTYLSSLTLPDPALDSNRDSFKPRKVSQKKIYQNKYTASSRNASKYEVPEENNHTRLLYSPKSNAVFKLLPFLSKISKVGSFRSDTCASRIRKYLFANSMSRSYTGGDVESELHRQCARQQSDFFTFLDRELEKVEKFYLEKEREAANRLRILHKQLQMLGNLYYDELRQSTENKKKRIGRSITQPIFVCKNQHSSSRNNNNHITQTMHNTESGNSKIHVLNRSHSKCVPSSNLGASPTNANLAILYSQSDYNRSVQAPDVSFKTAKRKLKHAFVEYYHSLELLKSYALLNGTSFRKITKKYNKTVEAESCDWYMKEKVNSAYFITSQKTELLIRQVENYYARYFEKGNHKIAVGKLKSKSAYRGEYGGSIFRNGCALATGLVLGIEGFVEGVQYLQSPEAKVSDQSRHLLQVSVATVFGCLALTSDSDLCWIFPHITSDVNILL